jgi:hypothetical protein
MEWIVGLAIAFLGFLIGNATRPTISPQNYERLLGLLGRRKKGSQAVILLRQLHNSRITYYEATALLLTSARRGARVWARITEPGSPLTTLERLEKQWGVLSTQVGFITPSQNHWIEVTDFSGDGWPEGRLQWEWTFLTEAALPLLLAGGWLLITQSLPLSLGLPLLILALRALLVWGVYRYQMRRRN